MTLVLVVLATTVLGNAFFVAAELSAVAVERARISHLAARGHRRATWLASLLASPARLDRYVAGCQVGITATSLVLGIYAQRSLTERLASGLAGTGWRLPGAAALASAVVLLALTGLQLIVGELVPKAVALAQPERVAIATSLPTRLATALFQPFIALLNGSANLLLRMAGLRPADTRVRLHSPAELELLIAEAAEAGRLDPIERRMLVRALRLSRRTVRQVMVPRPRLLLAGLQAAPVDVLARMAQTGLRRVAVYGQDFDDLQGIVELKDVLRMHHAGRPSIADAVRPVPFVPETMPLAELWQRLQQANAPVAIVLDEQGGSAGIVTREDLLEEIIGEVRDEFDAEPRAIERLADGGAAVRGDVPVGDVNELLGTALPTATADTVAGLVMELLGRVPEPGDRVSAAGVELEVRRVERRWAALVVVRPAAGAGHE